MSIKKETIYNKLRETYPELNLEPLTDITTIPVVVAPPENRIKAPERFSEMQFLVNDGDNLNEMFEILKTLKSVSIKKAVYVGNLSGFGSTRGRIREELGVDQGSAIEFYVGHERIDYEFLYNQYTRDKFERNEHRKKYDAYLRRMNAVANKNNKLISKAEQDHRKKWKMVKSALAGGKARTPEQIDREIERLQTRIEILKSYKRE